MIMIILFHNILQCKLNPSNKNAFSVIFYSLKNAHKLRVERNKFRIGINADDDYDVCDD